VKIFIFNFGKLEGIQTVMDRTGEEGDCGLKGGIPNLPQASMTAREVAPPVEDALTCLNPRGDNFHHA